MIRQFGNGVACRNDIDQDRIAVDNPPQGFAIRLIDALLQVAFRGRSALQLCEKTGQSRIAAGRRAPLHMNNSSALAREVFGKQLKSDVDDAWRRRQQSIRLDAIAVFVLGHFIRFSFAAWLAYLAKGVWQGPDGYIEDKGSVAWASSPLCCPVTAGPVRRLIAPALINADPDGMCEPQTRAVG